jgi:hypothetical protein
VDVEMDEPDGHGDGQRHSAGKAGLYRREAAPVDR